MSEKRYVKVDGHEFTLERDGDAWSVWWRSPPANCHAELGVLEPSPRGGLGVANCDQNDYPSKRALLVRVAAAAGLRVWSPEDTP